MSMRVMAAAAMIGGMAMPAAAAQPGAIGVTSRGAVAITASVAPQARLTADAGGACLWSNTATRLLAVTAERSDGAAQRDAVRDAIVTDATPGCTDGGRLTLATLREIGGTRTILVSPE